MSEPRTHRIRTAFWLEDVVFLRVRTERFAGMVTEVHVLPGSSVFKVVWEDATESCHNEFELTREFVPDYARTDDADAAETTPEPEVEQDGDA